MRYHGLACTLLTLALVACESAPKRDRADPSPAEEGLPSAEDLLAQGDPVAAARQLEERALVQSQPAEQRRLLIEAAHAWARAGEPAELLRLIGRLEAQLTSAEEQRQLRLLQARWHLLRQEPLLALARIQDLRNDRGLAPLLALRTAVVRAEALAQLQDGVAALQTLIDVRAELGPALESARQRQIRDLLLAPDLLWLRPPGGLEPRTEGWLALGEIGRRLWASPAELDAALQRWQQQYPGHPGEPMLAELATRAREVIASAPRRVALLLPLSGRLEPAGQAIRDGYFAAYYRYGEGRLDISLYDTEAQGASTAFDAAVAAGADLIVGPLQKEAVAAVARHNGFGLPHLALNSAPETGPERPWLLALSLPPEDDATAAARLALSQGHAQLVALHEAESWAQRSAEALGATLEAEGGALLDSGSFAGQSDYSDAIQRLLQLERSRDRAERVRNALGQRVEYEQTRRQDAQALYLAASVDDARQIRPQIRFFQGADLPVYASGRLFEGDPEAVERDLDGVHFCTSPWLLGSTEGWRDARGSFQRWQPGGDSAWARFHALGHDAYLLSRQVRGGGWPNGLSLAGASGDLRIEGSRISRQLPCAVYRDGRPELVSVP